jgi:hypothetical protein
MFDPLCAAAMFFVAMSYAFMYGTLPNRISAWVWGMSQSDKLPMFKKKVCARLLSKFFFKTL